MFADGSISVVIAVALALGLVIYWLSLRLGESLRHQAATNDVLKLVGNTTADLDTVLTTLIKTSLEICRADAVGIVRFNADGENDISAIRMPAAYQDHLRSVTAAASADTLIGRTILDGRTVRILDTTTDASLAGSLERRLFRSWLGIPLIMDGHTIAVMVLARSTPSLSSLPGRPTNVTSRLMWSRDLPFSDDEVELVSTFAQHATFALENARLFDEGKEQRHQLELANSYKSRFLAAASHDLRQPLHALNLLLAQLRASDDAAEHRAIVARMNTAVDSMNDLFDALMDTSKLDAGLLEPTISEFSIGRLLDRVEATLAPSASDKHLRLVCVHSDQIVRSDFVLLERMVANLLSNAIQYTTTGGVVLGVRRRGHALRIDVCDSGSGISHTHQQEIFREFYQLPSDNDRRSNSLGLGLAIVDRLARLLGHPIELQSIPGKGSRFSIYVPLGDGIKAGEDAQQLRRSSARPTIGSVAGRRIVVIEDDALVRSGMVATLQSWGCTVAAADTDTAALRITAEWAAPPDLIISDFHLGRTQTGIDAISRLRYAFDTNIPAFLISGDTTPQRRRQAKANALFLVHKPMSAMALRSMITRMLRDEAAAGRQAPSQH